MEKGWASIYSSSQEHVVTIAKDILEENNIASIIINKKDSSYLFGEIELFVKNENVIRAKYLLKNL